jgi:hypothetical protein
VFCFVEGGVTDYLANLEVLQGSAKSCKLKVCYVRKLCKHSSKINIVD